MPMKPNPMIPGYDVYNRLGGGLLSSVYLAREQSTDALCAVKVIRDDWPDRDTAVKLLQREARAGLLTLHPNLVKIRRAHVTREPYFLVMDLLNGECLRKRLRLDYRLPVPEVVWIGRQIAEGLAALHQNGFVHGDIKPDNILLTEDGRAMLLDLGFAHRPGENADFLRKGYILGTVDYLAPEQCCQQVVDDKKSDLFSLGVTLFELLTGELPYPKGSIDQTIRRHESDPPMDISGKVRPLPSSLARLVNRLLSRHADTRPSATQVIQQMIGLEIATMRKRISA